MEIRCYVLPVHAAAALGINIDQLNLPRCGDGFDADALWIDPRFIEVRRRREAIARQRERHPNNLHPDLQHKSRPHGLDDKDLKAMKRRARERRRKAMRAAAASI
jgi:hypothetical protein